MEGLVFVFNNLHSSGFFNSLMKFITLLGDGGFVWLVFAGVLLCFKKTRTCAVVMLSSLLVGYIINDFVLKLIFSRPRPFAVHPEFADFIKGMGIGLPSGYSFPSGHAFSSFNCAMIICLFHKKIGIGAMALAVLIGLSRIFFCVHYPTDVLAGAILGICVAVAVYVSYMGILRAIRKEKRKEIRRF